jgi:hypothetical protein
MVSALDWSVTPVDNTTIGGVTAADAMETIKVDDLSRALAAGVKSMALDIGGATASTGAANAYLFTSNGYVDALANGARLTFKANHPNTGAATLAVTTQAAVALGAKAIRKWTASGEVALGAGDIVSGMTYEVAYNTAANAAAGGWVLLNPTFYSIGSWTPVLTFGGGSSGLTYSAQNGAFHRIGTVVIAQIGMVLTAKGSSTGSASIAGLPYTVAATTGSEIPSAVNFTGLTGTLHLLTTAGGTSITFRQTTSTGAATLTDAAFTNTTTVEGKVI